MNELRYHCRMFLWKRFVLPNLLWRPIPPHRYGLFIERAQLRIAKFLVWTGIVSKQEPFR